jgi:prepilin peptidase CpaA
MSQTEPIHSLITVGFPIIVVFVGASVAAISDVVQYRVRNSLTFPLIATGLAYHLLFQGWPGLTTSVGGMLVGLGILIAPWLLGLMGAGDVKLLAAVGAWLGTTATVVTFVVASAATGLYAVVLIVYRGKFRESLLTMKVILYRFVALGTYLGKEDMVEKLSNGPDRRLRVIPFAAMVPLGIVAVLFWLLWLKGGF